MAALRPVPTPDSTTQILLQTEREKKNDRSAPILMLKYSLMQPRANIRYDYLTLGSTQ